MNLPSSLTAILCVLQAIHTSVSKPPNMVVLVLDDVGYGDLTSFWNPDNEPPSTPFIDSMAEYGIKFTDFVSPSSVCTASRGSLLTARMSKRTGLTNVIFPSSIEGLPLNETTFGETFKAAGYRTAMVGKWHVGEHGPYHATGRAIPLYDNDTVIEQPVDMRNLSKQYIEVTTRWIKEGNNTRPFLLYVGLALMHAPFYILPEFVGKSSRGTHYGDALLEMDWTVENIVNTIREIGEEENTLIWVASDNGPGEILCEYGGSPGPFTAEWQRNEGGGGSGSKWSIWEGGLRLPALAYWPGTIKGGQVSDELVSIMDIYPTMASFAGVEMPGDRIYDGIDISNILLGKALYTAERVLYFQNSEYHQDERNGNIEAVRVGQYKGVYKTGGTMDCNGISGPDVYYDTPLIFNVKTDAAESSPLTEASRDYSSALAIIQQAMGNLNVTLAEGKVSTIDYTNNPCVAPCCNSLKPNCRC
ncbi:Arylsulfatase G [Holothuria leucospilota]|uniref:Arylsulfatase G n=1 Tax=Holothuria leucospilota TaxID=206669 RepID=A0A9Q1C3Y7_HOLLE|nr:Arylsulfatase G [Holothuria leucospilota]